MASDRLLPLDGLRGLAALLVVGYHYTTRYQELFGHPAPLRLSLPLGHYGVQLFFVISGFVIFMTLERTQDWRDFLVSRFARLFPAYWVAVLLTWLVVWRFSLPGREVPASAMWINLTMLQGWLHAPHVDGVYWTLTVELAFYAMVLCLHALRLLPRLPLVVAGWLCAMLVSHWAETRLGWRWTDMARTTLLLEHANLFMAGMLLYRGVRGEGGRRATAGLLLACLLVEFVVHGAESGLVCAVFFGLLLVALRPAGGGRVALSAPPLVWLGGISYSLYLLHQNIGYVLLRSLYSEGMAPVMAIPLTLLAALALAAAVRHWVEVPGRALIRQRWQRYRRGAG